MSHPGAKLALQYIPRGSRHARALRPQSSALMPHPRRARTDQHAQHTARLAGITPLTVHPISRELGHVSGTSSLGMTCKAGRCLASTRSASGHARTQPHPQ